MVTPRALTPCNTEDHTNVSEELASYISRVEMRNVKGVGYIGKIEVQG
jgi:hypothetical protein